MIVELDDGSELVVPDSWTEARARKFGLAFMAGKISADAVAEAARDAAAEDDTSLAGEVRRMKETLDRVLLAVSADRVLIRGSNGEAFASRVNIPRPSR